MAPMDDQRATLTSALRSVLDHLRSDLLQRETAEVEELIENFEFGVALDWMTGLVEKHALLLSDAARASTRAVELLARVGCDA